MIYKKINGIDLYFKTHPSLFSPCNIDQGTLALLSVVELKAGDKVLDLGCGYGAIGIYAAKILGAENVVMSDVDGTAVELSKENESLNDLSGIRIVQGDSYKCIADNDFTVILINPPYHVDFSLPKIFIEKGHGRLQENGRMYLVAKRKVWYKNKLISVFGGVKIWYVGGYNVFMSMKRN
jgi:16S rRNA (guanine1207-N2)-methyltransferase